MRGWWSFVLALSACADPQFFLCNNDGECGDGHCEENGFCSFDDPDCESGRRYGDLAAGGLAGTCVDVGGLNLWVGNHDNQNRTFDGVLDEVRIYPGLRDEDWHRAQYQAMQDEVVSYGEAEAAPG